MSVRLETGSCGASGRAFHVKRARQIVMRFQNPKIHAWVKRARHVLSGYPVH